MMKKTWKVWLAVLAMMSLGITAVGCGSEEKKEDTNVSSEKEADTKTEDVAEDETDAETEADAEADGDAEVEADTENEVDTEMELELPWENGGKQPEEYTWEEFEALEGGQQIAFQNSFADIDAFDEWMQSARGENTDAAADTEVELPWEDGGKQPEEYTWEEFEALEGGQQIAFQNSFADIDAFDEWMQSVRGEDAVTEAVTEDEFELPWENGGKQPEEYTWEEFEALEGGQQIAFQNSFENIDAFDAWLQKVNPQ